MVEALREAAVTGGSGSNGGDDGKGGGECDGGCEGDGEGEGKAAPRRPRMWCDGSSAPRSKDRAAGAHTARERPAARAH